MRSSDYFRAQARLYRDIARLLSDRQAAEGALLSAMEYLAHAQELEDREQAAERKTHTS
jgi:hypothetical protein